MTDLSAPLTPRSARQKKLLPTRLISGMPVSRLALGGIALIAVAVGGYLLFVDDPMGGRPVAEVAVHAGPGNSLADSVVARPATITVGPEIPADTALIPEVEPQLAALVEPDGNGLFPDLLEETEYGPIPRVSAAGDTPFAAYSRASVTPATSGGRPLVAIVVSGMGLNVAGTLDAVARLPDEVSLGFAPYGKSLDRTLGAARAEGHEIFLEVPLEPFDYPDNDPGPDTLLTGQPPRDNLARLFAVMGKFQGYAGLINNMGARFTASASDFSPMMEELGARGLGYLDDGSSNRSLAPQLAGANRVPFRRVDLALDLDPSRAAILEQLAELEARARDTGSAIGIVAALPVSVQTVTEWARGLAERGVLLVPASALMAR